MTFQIRASSAVLLVGVVLAGCAGDGADGLFTTGSLSGSQAAAAAPKVDPVCVTLAARIDGLRKEGIAEKIEKAAAKKYKMTAADLTQGRPADQGQRRLPVAVLDDHAEADDRPSSPPAKSARRAEPGRAGRSPNSARTRSPERSSCARAWLEAERGGVRKKSATAIGLPCCKVTTVQPLAG